MGVDDEYVASELARAKLYTVVYLRPGPRYGDPDDGGLVYEHVKRNFELKLAGDIAIVGPTRSEGEVCGLYIFNCDPARATELVETDPAVMAGFFTSEVQAMMAFPGDTLA